MRRGWEILIVPRSPSRAPANRDAELFRRISVAEPVLSLRIVLAAVGILLRHPVRSVVALAALLRSGDLRNVFRNLVVYAKSLWLAGLARDWRADHIHAHWLTTTSTMAMIASEIFGIPWSSTAHRGDIARHNLLPLKLSRAKFVRFISEDGMRLIEAARRRVEEEFAVQNSIAQLFSCIDPGGGPAGGKPEMGSRSRRPNACSRASLLVRQLR